MTWQKLRIRERHTDMHELDKRKLLEETGKQRDEIKSINVRETNIGIVIRGPKNPWATSEVIRIN